MDLIIMRTFTIQFVVSVILLTTVVVPRSTAAALDRTDKKLKVVVFGGHPDDPESGAGGLIASLTRHGHEVICAYGTTFRSDRRFFGRPEGEVRREEATAGCNVLGAKPHFFPYAHETLVADAMSLKNVSAWLDEVKPDVVVTHWLLDTHPNHHVVSSLVWQSYQRKGGWTLYFFEVMTDQQTIGFAPDLYLDIAPVRDVKKRALDAHKSQGPEAIWKAHERMHRRRGAECGVEYAEAFTLVEAKEGCPLLPVTFLRRKNPSTTNTPDVPATITESKREENGVLVHTVTSEYQDGQTKTRVLLPSTVKKGNRYPVVYILPVEARDEHHYGDGLREIQRLGLHDNFPTIFVAPTFSQLPWYADHPTRVEMRQESYFLNVVIPFVEARYPARSEPASRLLLGFSKSGWGAWSLLLRHPDLFGKAAAWDAPLVMDRPGKYGSGVLFDTPENFENHRVLSLLPRRTAELRDHPRLILLGYGNFRGDHETAHDLMVALRIPHVYADGPKREHRWESAWLPEAVKWLRED
jgi:LmbE family N-acetylglucosaminyl deacetylase